MELWAKAGFCLEDNQQIAVVAGPDSTGPMHGVRLRNGISWASSNHSKDAATFIGGFVAEAAGTFASKVDAVSFLSTQASPYFQILAVVANAGVEEPEDLVAYAPPANPDDKG